MNGAKNDIAKNGANKPVNDAPTELSLSNLAGPESRAFFLRYGMVAALIVMSCFMMYITYGTPDAATKSFYFYLFLCTFPILIAMYVGSPLYSEKLTNTTMFLYGGAAIVVLIGLYYFYKIMNPGSVSILTTLSTGLIVLGILVGLAILYRVLMRYVNMTRGWFGFFVQLLFYIPCLLIEFVQAFMDELSVAPSMVAVLFVIEILIVLGYLYLPRLLVYLRSDSMHVLLDAPVFLNKPAVLAKHEDFLLDKTRKDVPEKIEDLIRVNYSIAFWVYVNAGSSNGNAEANILSYSPPGVYNGKPAIRYSGGNLNFYLTNAESASADSVSLPIGGQKWNYVVVTYSGQKADVYLNAELKYSTTFNATVNGQDNGPTYSSTDVIQIGETGGVYGAMRNLVYYKTPINLGEIVDAYNISKMY